MGKYKCVILAAGVGSRMKEFSKDYNKVLIPVKGKPVIGHIIEKFNKDIEIVIAVGYKKETVIDYVKSNYPERNFNFVDVGKFEGPGTGPGYSLLMCKEFLQCPFIQFAGDTLVKEEIIKPEENWVGVSEVKNTERFCSARIENEKIVRIDDKKNTDNKHAFIGLFGVKDFTDFWEGLENRKELISGEVQVSNGLQALIKKDFHAKEFTWFDTGTPEAYGYALKNFPDGEGFRG